MSASVKIAINYGIFALIAIIVNIGVQVLVVRIYNGAFHILISVIVGTGVGLVVKYILDKRFIFRFHTHSMIHDTQTFILYTVMGLFTTMIFWGFEFGFYYIFESAKLRYLGGILGLAIGYYAKYQLDKRYVFCARVI